MFGIKNVIFWDNLGKDWQFMGFLSNIRKSWLMEILRDFNYLVTDFSYQA
jgi:hypothetical protein